MTNKIRFGVIGGSGVYQMEALQNVEEVTLETPFGAPSDNYIIGTLHNQRVAFLARHGRGHRISPTRLNQRAAEMFRIQRLDVADVAVVERRRHECVGREREGAADSSRI